uniref:ANF_receptor domain-containing protein n=1 Tax=Ascaris lumbricoides TaxID=6252 RepID=A0A0M3I6G8_ASCLU
MNCLSAVISVFNKPIGIAANLTPYGKLAASVKWLIGRVYGGSAPDLLQNPIRYNDNNTFQLETTVVTALTNSSLYSNAAAKIFKDQNLINVSFS